MILRELIHLTLNPNLFHIFLRSISTKHNRITLTILRKDSIAEVIVKSRQRTANENNRTISLESSFYYAVMPKCSSFSTF